MVKISGIVFQSEERKRELRVSQCPAYCLLLLEVSTLSIKVCIHPRLPDSCLPCPLFLHQIFTSHLRQSLCGRRVDGQVVEITLIYPH